MTVYTGATSGAHIGYRRPQASFRNVTSVYRLAAEDECDMESAGSDVQALLVNPDEISLPQLLALDENDSVLANAIRRVIEAANWQPQDVVAAFNNYI